MPITPSALTQAVRELDELSVSQRIRKFTVTPKPNAVMLDFTTNHWTTWGARSALTMQQENSHDRRL